MKVSRRAARVALLLASAQETPEVKREMVDTVYPALMGVADDDGVSTGDGEKEKEGETEKEGDEENDVEVSRLRAID